MAKKHEVAVLPAAKLLNGCNLWTAVGLNNQSTFAGQRMFPRSLYPIKWYLSFDMKGAEIERLGDMIISKIEQEGKADESIGRIGRYIYGYFKNSESFKKVVDEIVGDDKLEVRELNGELQLLNRENLVQKAQEIYNSYRENRVEFVAV